MRILAHVRLDYRPKRTAHVRVATAYKLSPRTACHGIEHQWCLYDVSSINKWLQPDHYNSLGIIPRPCDRQNTS